MATKGKTRGPKEHKYVKKADDNSPKFESRRKKQEKAAGSKKK